MNVAAETSMVCLAGSVSKHEGYCELLEIQDDVNTRGVGSVGQRFRYAIPLHDRVTHRVALY